jgi:putative restriction endonuclease
LGALICDAVDLDLAELETAAAGGQQSAAGPQARKPRRAGFAEEVLRAYAYQCAMCGFDGALGRNPVGIEAAHVRWHSQNAPDEVANGLVLCALHHVLLDLGVLASPPRGASGSPACSSPAARPATRWTRLPAARCRSRAPASPSSSQHTLTGTSARCSRTAALRPRKPGGAVTQTPWPAT